MKTNPHSSSIAYEESKQNIAHEGHKQTTTTTQTHTQQERIIMETSNNGNAGSGGELLLKHPPTSKLMTQSYAESACTYSIYFAISK